MLIFFILGYQILHFGNLLGVTEQMSKDKFVLAFILYDVLFDKLLRLDTVSIFDRIRHCYRKTTSHRLRLSSPKQSRRSALTCYRLLCADI